VSVVITGQGCYLGSAVEVNPMAPELSAFEETYKKLPPDAQQRVQAWMGSQMFIAHELGLGKDEWLKYVSWAFLNPLDFSFAGEGAENMVLGDTVEYGGDARAAERVTGRPKANTPSDTPADPTTSRKAGLSNIHTLGAVVPKKKR
jgi:hypothetical protein